jgi:hypothetical protein
VAEENPAIQGSGLRRSVPQHVEDGEPYLTMKHSQLQDGRNGQEKPTYRGAIYGPERGSNFRRGSAEAVAAEKVACVALLAQTWARRTVRAISA